MTEVNPDNSQAADKRRNDLNNLERVRECAPDAIAALRALLLQCIQSGVVFERDACVAQARAVIAKAEGRADG